MRNHMGLSDLITERDAPALAHLTDITVAQLVDGVPGFKLTFHFSPNEYFVNDVLTKTYIYTDELSYQGDYVYKRAEGCTIQWYASVHLFDCAHQQSTSN